MMDPVSSRQSNPAIVRSEVGSGNAGRVPVGAVFSSAQSHHLASTWYRDSVNCVRAYSVLQSFFSGARTSSVRGIPGTFLTAQRTTPVQVPVEMVDASPMLQDMDIRAEDASSAAYFYPIVGDHFREWLNYNAECDSRIKPGDSVPPEMDVRELLKMMNDVHGNTACADKPSGAYREQEFAWEHNIDPLVWVTTVMLNRHQTTFLPREDHYIVANTKGRATAPITVLDVKAWQHYAKHQKSRGMRSCFAAKRNIHPHTFLKLVNPQGQLYKSLDGFPVWQKTFVPPQLLDNSQESSQQITAEILTSWDKAKTMNDYGMMLYLRQTGTWSPAMRNEAYFLRKRQEKGAVLTASDVARECHVTLAISEKMLSELERWRCMPALQRLGYAMGQFASDHFLDESCWYFFAWSNELASLKQLMQEGEQVQQIGKELSKWQERLKTRVERVIEHRWPQSVS
jgi:hypothetical protein